MEHLKTDIFTISLVLITFNIHGDQSNDTPLQIQGAQPNTDAAIRRNVIRNSIDIGGCANIRGSQLEQVRARGHIDAVDCTFTNLDANGYTELVNSCVKENVKCGGELTLKKSTCAHVYATTKLITLIDASIKKLEIKKLMLKNNQTIDQKVIIKGNSSIGEITFVDGVAGIVLIEQTAQVGNVSGGSVRYL